MLLCHLNVWIPQRNRRSKYNDSDSDSHNDDDNDVTDDDKDHDDENNVSPEQHLIQQWYGKCSTPVKTCSICSSSFWLSGGVSCTRSTRAGAWGPMLLASPASWHHTFSATQIQQAFSMSVDILLYSTGHTPSIETKHRSQTGGLRLWIGAAPTQRYALA